MGMHTRSRRKGKLYIIYVLECTPRTHMRCATGQTKAASFLCIYGQETKVNETIVRSFMEYHGFCQSGKATTSTVLWFTNYKSQGIAAYS